MIKRLYKLAIWSGIFFSCMAFSYPPTTNESHLDEKVVPTDAMCHIKNTAFKGGEELIYKVYYNLNFVWIPAGEVAFRVKDLGSKYYITARGRSYKSYDWFFKVRDNYEVYIDKNTLLPTKSLRQVRQGGYRLYDKMTWDQESYKIHSMRGRSKEKANELKYDLNDCMHDLLSIFYYCRNLDFNHMKKGERFPARVFLDKEVYHLGGKYLGVEQKKIRRQGKFKTIKISPQLVEGTVFKKTDAMKIWVTTDLNHIALQIESPVTVGSIKAVLKSYKGLRHPLSSKVKK